MADRRRREPHTREDPDTEKRYAALRAFARDQVGVKSTYEWSAHDYMPLDRLPYVGQVLPGDAQLLTATGFAKWGLTKATIAAQIVVDLILGRENPSASFYDARRLNLRQSARPFLEANAHVAWRFVGDRLRSEPAEAVGGLAPGEGMVVRVGTRHDAVSRDRDGVLHTVSARCTHLGCLVGWNRADEVWECPCHGSVFAADGRLIEGPATRDLPRRAV